MHAMNATPVSMPEQQVAALLAGGQIHQALTAAAEGLAQQPDNAELCNLAGICAALLGYGMQAEQLWQQAIALVPHAQAHFNLGLLYANANRLDEAERHYRCAIELEPGNAPAHYNLAILLASRQCDEEAANCYRQAIQADPANAAAHANLGVLLAGRQQVEAAEQYYRQALVLDPEHAAAHLGLGVLLAQRNQLAEAEQHYRQAIALHPQSAEAHTNLGLLLEKLQQSEAAEQCHRTALSCNAGHAEIHSNLANLLAAQRREEEAEQHYRRALELKPDDAIICSNSGALLATLKRDEQAEQLFRQAIALSPGYALAHLNLAQLLLSQGRYREGWVHYEARYAAALPDQVPFPSHLSCPQWRGESLAGKSLLVWTEQGLGDEIQFCRFLPQLRSQCARITLVCKMPLVPLLETLAGVDEVLAYEAGADPGTHDYWTPPLSLPLHCATTLENIPDQLPYLHALPERIERWAPRLPQSGFRVGLVWQGNIRHSNDSERSLPGLETLAPLWSIPGLSLVGLQKDARGTAASADLPLLELGEELADLADTAAVVAQLDLLISVDSAVAHLAGALGKPCWLLLPAHKTDWRWLNARGDTPWYPGVMRLFRQQQRGDWTPLIEQVRQALLREMAG